MIVFRKSVHNYAKGDQKLDSYYSARTQNYSK